MGLLWQLIFGFDAETQAKHPSMFITNNIDRHQCRRIVPMQVLSLGMSRTGTASMKAALTILGYPTAHGFDMHSNPRDCEMWMEAFDAKYHGNTKITLDGAFWDKLLGHVSATTDMPCNFFGPELVSAYPDAKVILVERDMEKWFKSFEQAIITNCDRPRLLRLFAKMDPNKGGHMIPVLLDGTMHDYFHAQDSKEFRQNARTVYREHYAMIREIMKDQPDRLLEFKLEEGWEPLCKFLGKEIPDVPFPRVNEQAMHDELMRGSYAVLTRRCIVNFCIWVLPVLLAWRIWKQYFVSR